MSAFEKINKGFNSVFEINELSIGIVVPIENYSKSTVPSMKNHLSKVKLVEDLGFKALWVRDVPFHLPDFGDAGQTYDPFTYLGYLAASTSSIALGVSSIALPLHYPVHVAKSAATIDQLSNGRLILGVASGDRHEEYPAMNIQYEKRGELFRQAFQTIRHYQDSFPIFETSEYGKLTGNMDVIPKAKGLKIPMLITGNSRQSIEWIADHGDGWMYYPRNFYMQELNIKEWRDSIPDKQNVDKPFMQPLYVDLHPDDDFKAQRIHLGFKIGSNYLVDYLNQLKEIGVNHVAINLRFNSHTIEHTLEDISKKIMPRFHKKVV